MTDISTAPAIRTEGLCKVYHTKKKTTRAVDGLDLSVVRGEFFSLLGVNGAGKTTAIKMLSCLTPPTSGKAAIMGRDITAESEEVRRLINVSPQSTAVALNLTVKENLALSAGLWGIPAARIPRAVGEMIGRMGLGNVQNDRARTLSGGWQRRVSIAMALITEPQVLFLDEPTLGLDVLARRELWRVIEALRGRVTVVLTTHYLEEAEALSDRIGIMAQGRLCALGTPPELCALAGAKKFEDAFVELASRPTASGEVGA